MSLKMLQSRQRITSYRQSSQDSAANTTVWLHSPNIHRVLGCQHAVFANWATSALQCAPYDAITELPEK